MGGGIIIYIESAESQSWRDGLVRVCWLACVTVTHQLLRAKKKKMILWHLTTVPLSCFEFYVAMTGQWAKLNMKGEGGLSNRRISLLWRLFIYSIPGIDKLWWWMSLNCHSDVDIISIWEGTPVWYTYVQVERVMVVRGFWYPYYTHHIQQTLCGEHTRRDSDSFC